MDTVYKITSRNMCTFGECKWKLGETKKIAKALRKRPRLCADSVLHAFVHPLQMIIYQNRYELFSHPRFFLGKGNIVIARYDKVAVLQLTLIKELKFPNPTKLQLAKILAKILAGADRYVGTYKDIALNYSSRSEVLIHLGDCMEHWGYKKRLAVYKAYDELCGKPKVK